MSLQKVCETEEDNQKHGHGSLGNDLPTLPNKYFYKDLEKANNVCVNYKTHVVNVMFCLL